VKISASARPYRVGSDGGFEVAARGFDVLHTPEINKGTAFTLAEREALGLTGLLPSTVLTLEQQAQRAYQLYLRQPDELAKNSFLSALQDRNETLFYYLLLSHVEEMFPIVYTPTVGTAIQQYSHQFRRPRGIFLSIDKPEKIEESLRNAAQSGEDIDLIVTTDSESILGIGDWGVGGIDICVGKLAVYTAAAGIDPGRTIPVALDVGTDNQSLLEDPLYLGYRERRVRGERYQRFVHEYITTALKLFPNALLHWEDFSALNARWILKEYRAKICTFNDDMQGTAGVVLSAIFVGQRVASMRMRDLKAVIFGAGTAGCGIADLLRSELVNDGLSPEEAAARIWLVDRDGLIVNGSPNIRDHQAAYARRPEEVSAWRRNGERGIMLDEVVRQVHPNVLIGSSAVSGAFTETIVRELAKGTPRPIILPLSNPTSLSEALPADLIAWTEGRGLVATGSPFKPVLYNGVSYTIGQANNSALFPGLGLGTVVTRARTISDSMFGAAARAIAAMVDAGHLGASILPPISNLREVSANVATAVGKQAMTEGLARNQPADLERAIRSAMWEPAYRPMKAI
jgi:malate dehydrogenase (oxaloacetate-decarboxylating)